MREFLAENNACGQNLLNIVATGNSIIAEILRLKDYVPDIFRLSTKEQQQKYGEIILDFKYLSIAEAQEQKIESQPELRDLDDEIRENYLELLTRFYMAFESTHQYATDLQNFIDELNNGYYIQQSLESVLQDEEGKQLLTEALYLFGVILLIVDFHIPGIIRERLLTAYYRYCGAKSHGDSDIDDVCMLLRSTGFVASHTPNNNAKTPLNYPEDYFSRFSFDQTFLDMVLARLRCDDIYNQLSIYPHPEHRSTALANQASMLFVCLYFSPKILHLQVAQMREIVDKFFLDNWMVCIYMGLTVNLIDAWQHFKAAKAALAPVYEANSLTTLCSHQQQLFDKTLQNTLNILRDGVLTDYFVLQRINKILALIRVCNVLLRWYFLHGNSAVWQISLCTPKAVTQAEQTRKLLLTHLQYNAQNLLQLLLDCSQLELTVKQILKNLLAEREQRWLEARKEAMERMQELSEAFSGSHTLSRLQSNSQLQQWFAEIAKQIEDLNVEKPNAAGRMIIQLIQALEEVEEFHNLQHNMQIKQYLLETREYLHKMIQIVNVKEDLLIKLQLISDLSYAWHLFNRDFTTHMQESIQKQPRSVIRLRAAFLKLASAMEIPLLRINQAKSADLPSVSNYYSTELANYMRQVMQIIPASMFSLLARIIELQTNSLKQMPLRLEKDKLREFAQFEQRYAVSKLTHSIAVFTEGVLMMKKTLVGVLELDPKQLLEDGIRKELVQQLTRTLHEHLTFLTPKQRSKLKLLQLQQQLEGRLEQLAFKLDGYRRSFVYIQDYLKVHGLKILQQELTRIINYHVEQECNLFVRNKVQNWQSQYQSSTIPVPALEEAAGAHNFIGRLAEELLACSQAQQSFYMPLKGAWFERSAPHRQIINGALICKIRSAMGPVTLVGLELLYGHMVGTQLRQYLEKIQQNLQKEWQPLLSKLSGELEAGHLSSPSVVDVVKYYGQYHEPFAKVWPIMSDWLLELGQKQLLRQQMASELSRSAKCNSKHLQSAIETFNSAVLLEYCGKELEQQEHLQLLAEMREYLIFTGAHNPLEDVFTTTKHMPLFTLFFSLFIISHATRLHFTLPLPKSAKNPLDGHTLIVGLCTVFKQVHREHINLLLSYLCQYVNALIAQNLSTKQELSVEAYGMLQFIEYFAIYAHVPRTELLQRLSELVINHWKYMENAVKN